MPINYCSNNQFLKSKKKAIGKKSVFTLFAIKYLYRRKLPFDFDFL